MRGKKREVKNKQCVKVWSQITNVGVKKKDWKRRMECVVLRVKSEHPWIPGGNQVKGKAVRQSNWGRLKWANLTQEEQQGVVEGPADGAAGECCSRQQSNTHAVDRLRWNECLGKCWAGRRGSRDGEELKTGMNRGECMSGMKAEWMDGWMVRNKLTLLLISSVRTYWTRLEHRPRYQ